MANSQHDEELFELDRYAWQKKCTEGLTMIWLIGALPPVHAGRGVGLGSGGLG